TSEPKWTSKRLSTSTGDEVLPFTVVRRTSYQFFQRHSPFKSWHETMPVPKNVQTHLPSLTGVGVASPYWLLCRPPLLDASGEMSSSRCARRHSSRPDSASKQISTSGSDVRNTRLPTTMGVEFPFPTSVFQRMFWSADHDVTGSARGYLPGDLPS